MLFVRYSPFLINGQTIPEKKLTSLGLAILGTTPVFGHTNFIKHFWTFERILQKIVQNLYFH